MSSKTNLDVPRESADDHYTASIELSNACREFYRNRVKATESFKEKMGTQIPKPVQRKTGIDAAMDKLKSEMASLMDQDLSLMKQLLTLNEAIEDLKVKRLYHLSKDSMRTSSQEMHASDWSVSETDMFDSDDEEFVNDKTLVENERVSSLSLPVPSSSSTPSSSTSVHISASKRRNSDMTLMMHGSPIKVRHGQQSSIDSGYGEESSAFSGMYNGPLEVSF